jgi:hypothetical protein
VAAASIVPPDDRKFHLIVTAFFRNAARTEQCDLHRAARVKAVLAGWKFDARLGLASPGWK